MDTPPEELADNWEELDELADEWDDDGDTEAAQHACTAHA